MELDTFEAEWGHKYRAVVRLWRGNWDTIIPFFQFLPEIRKVIYTTNAIESLNMVMRLGVAVEALLADDGKASNKRGPTPKLQQQMDRITQLPRTKQQFVMQVIDSVLAQATR